MSSLKDRPRSVSYKSHPSRTRSCLPRYWSSSVSCKFFERLSWNFWLPLSPRPYQNDISHSPTFRMSTSVKSLCFHEPYTLLIREHIPGAYFCRNQAPVTIESFSLNCPKHCGLSATTTTAFCTVLLVTSGGLFRSSLASICRVHDMPKTEVGGLVAVAFWRRVK